MTHSKEPISLTDNERRVLAIYRDPKLSGLGRATRLSAQYAVGAAIFLYLAVTTGNPWWSVVIYGVLVTTLSLRLLGARKISGVMSSVIVKYEARIRELEKLNEE